MTKDAALTEAINMLTAIAGGKSFDSLDYFNALNRFKAASMNTITLSSVVDYLDRMGFDASVEDSGGNLEIIRVSGDDGDYYMIDNHGEGWGFTAHHADDEEYESLQLGNMREAYDAAMAIVKAINPNSGRR